MVEHGKNTIEYSFKEIYSFDKTQLISRARTLIKLIILKITHTNTFKTYESQGMP